MDTTALPTTTIRASEEQRANLRHHLEQENQHRRSVGLEPFDLEDDLKREIVELEYAIYHDRLRPFIEGRFDQYPGFPGIAGRIRGHIDLYDAAFRALRDEEGIVPPHAMRLDLVKFLELYQRGNLNQWGGAFVILE